MGRSYTQLECGCLISCDGGGGRMSCDSENCKAKEYMNDHKRCRVCGECMTCYEDHCMAGAIDHTCEDWDLFIKELEKIHIPWFRYCPWCGEKLEKGEKRNGQDSQKEEEGI